MTVRAVMLGLLGAMLIAVLAYLNDDVWVLSSFIGSHMPVFVFASLVVTALAINPLLFLVNRNWRLAPKELAVIVMMMLVACSIPSYGFLGTYVKSQIMPTDRYRTETGWQKNELREYIPSHMLAAEGKYVPEFTDSGMSGAGEQGRAIPLDEVPWRFWSESLTTWVPLVVLMAIAVICLALIFHRQWSQAERLRYPIVEVANVFMQQDPDRSSPSLFRTSAFWWALAIVLFVRVSNGIYIWSDGNWIKIPMLLDFYAILYRFPSIHQADPMVWWWFAPRIFPTIIAIAFLLATDVSLSVGIAPIAFTAVSWVLLHKFGYSLTAANASDYMVGGVAIWQRFGSYLALAVMIGYTGRRYYSGVLKSALAFSPSDGVESYAAWACRILIVVVVSMMLILSLMGVPWPIAILTVLLVLLVFVGISRVNAESGLFVNWSRWQPLGVLLGLFGAAAMGPQAIMIVGLFCMIFTVQPLESLMTFFMNGLRMCDMQKIRPARVAGTAMGTYLLVLALAIPVVLWAAHSYGLQRGRWTRRWSTSEMPFFYYDAGDKQITEIKNAGLLTRSESYTATERLANMEVFKTWKIWENQFIVAAGLGVLGVLGLSILRLRMPRLPIHPMIFLIWGTRHTAEVATSFLIGWAIKSGVTRLGGMQSYKTARKFMFGAIAGDLIGALVFMAVGMIHYIITGEVHRTYYLFPQLA